MQRESAEHVEGQREIEREKRPQGASWTILFCKVAKKFAQREAGQAGGGVGGTLQLSRGL